MTTDLQDLAIPGGPAGETWLRLLRPAGSVEPLPIVVYVHDGEHPLHDAHVRRMAARLMTGLPVAVVAVDYSLSPRARLPVALLESSAAVDWLAAHGHAHGLDGSRIAVAADPGVADLAARLMATTAERGGPSLAAHVPAGPRMRASLRAALGLPRPILERAT